MRVAGEGWKGMGTTSLIIYRGGPVKSATTAADLGAARKILLPSYTYILRNGIDISIITRHDIILIT